MQSSEMTTSERQAHLPRTTPMVELQVEFLVQVPTQMRPCLDLKRLFGSKQLRSAPSLGLIAFPKVSYDLNASFNMFANVKVRRLELQLADAQEAQAEAEQISARRLQKNKRLEARLADSERACADTERRVAGLETDLRAAPAAER